MAGDKIREIRGLAWMLRTVLLSEPLEDGDGKEE